MMDSVMTFSSDDVGKSTESDSFALEIPSLPIWDADDVRSAE